jgi:chemotaxis protein CheD
MDEPANVRDVFLGPGEVYFGDRETRIRTLLGSCVAVTVWHPRALLGGMCHYMVPTRGPARRPHELCGRYADEALDLLHAQMYAVGTPAQDYQVKIFGGGNQFSGQAAGMDIAGRNVEAGLELLRKHGLPPASMHLGGTGHRQVILEVWNGAVWMRHQELAEELTSR